MSTPIFSTNHAFPGSLGSLLFDPATQFRQMIFGCRHAALLRHAIPFESSPGSLMMEPLLPASWDRNNAPLPVQLPHARHRRQTPAVKRLHPLVQAHPEGILRELPPRRHRSPRATLPRLLQQRRIRRIGRCDRLRLRLWAEIGHTRKLGGFSFFTDQWVLSSWTPRQDIRLQ